MGKLNIQDTKYCLRVLREHSFMPTNRESKLINALYVALGYFDSDGNPKSRRMKSCAGQLKCKKK